MCWWFMKTGSLWGHRFNKDFLHKVSIYNASLAFFPLLLQIALFGIDQLGCSENINLKFILINGITAPYQIYLQ